MTSNELFFGEEKVLHWKGYIWGGTCALLNVNLQITTKHYMEEKRHHLSASHCAAQV